MTADEARAFAEQWGEWKGLAAYYLEVAAMSGIQPGNPGKGLESYPWLTVKKNMTSLKGTIVCSHPHPHES